MKGSSAFNVGVAVGVEVVCVACSVVGTEAVPTLLRRLTLWTRALPAAGCECFGTLELDVSVELENSKSGCFEKVP
jgi:hypothetical protein